MIASLAIINAMSLLVLAGTPCVDPPGLVRVGPNRPITTIAGGIQQALAIVQAMPGTVPKILVDPGSYLENLTLPSGPGGPLDVILEGRPLSPCDVVIDGSAAQLPVIDVTAGQTAATVIRGFTITGGSGAGATPPFGVGRWGGGIYVVDSNPIIENNIIEDNLVQDAGGGIYCGRSSALIRDNIFRQNVAEGRGGGVALSESTAVVLENRFIVENEDCAAWSGNYANLGLLYGGAIASYEEDASIIYRNEIRGNRGRSGGGIAVLESSTPIIAANEITRNGNFDSVDYGGGIFVEDSNPCILSNVIAFNGKVGDEVCFAPLEGGGIYLQNSAAEIVGNTIWGNVTLGSAFDPAVGGGIAIYGFAAPLLRNNLIWDNVADPQFGPNLYESMFVSPIHDLNCIENGSNPFDFFAADPGLIDPDGEDFHLKFTSELKDVGSTAAGSCVLSPTDFEGDLRVVGTGIDIGADEFSEHLYHIGPTITPTTGGVLRVTGLPGRSVGVFYSPLKLSPGYEFPVGINDANWFLGLNTVPDCDFDGFIVETPTFFIYNDGSGAPAIRTIGADGYVDYLLPPIPPLACPFTLYFQGLELIPPNAKYVTNLAVLKLE